jgi:hypothetical protein
MRIRTYIVAAAAIVMAVASGPAAVAATAAPSAAAAHVAAAGHAAPLADTPACYASPSTTNCDRTDPFNNTNNPNLWCGSGSYVVNSQPVYFFDLNNGQINYSEWTGWIQVWYSPHCGTNWARYVDTSGISGVVTTWTCRSDLCTSEYSSSIFPSWSDQVYAPTVNATAYAEFACFSGCTAEGNASTGP